MSRLAVLVLVACATPAPSVTPIGAHAPDPAPGGLVRGRVIDRAGHPVANATVSTDRPPDPLAFVARTSKTGEFALRFGEPYLTNGFELHAWLGDAYAAMPVAIPRAATNTVVEITVLPVGRVRGVLAGAKRVMFVAEFGSKGSLFAPVAADGTFSARLPVGAYLAGDADAPSNLEPVEVVQDAETTVTITR